MQKILTRDCNMDDSQRRIKCNIILDMKFDSNSY